MRNTLKRRWTGLGLALMLGAAPVLRSETTTNLFGFTGPEIFPIDEGISQLRGGDLDGDGLNDLVVANNLRSKIELLYNQTGQTNAAARSNRKLELNELPPDTRFRLDSLPTDERIAALLVADLNGDGRPDLVYFGDGHDLVVRYNQGTNSWSEPKRWHIEDGQMDANALVTGDLNGDGRTDVVLLGEGGAVYFFPQQADGTLGEPQKIPYSGTPKAVQIVDVNSDGRGDLLLVDFDSPTPFRFRLQNAVGQLGPEIYFKSAPIRSYTADDLEQNGTNFVVSIGQSSGRAHVSQFLCQPAAPLSGALRQGQFQIFPLTKSETGQRGLLWADVNGDGRADLLVAEPERGQVSVYLQQLDGNLGPVKTFPTLAGVSQMVAADWNGDGHSEIFLLSRDENAVGMSHFDANGKLAFPTILPLPGKPLVMTTGVLKRGTKPVLAVLVDKDGVRSLVIRSADGKTRVKKLSDSFKTNPASLAVADANQDGRPDLVVLIPYEKIKVLLQKASGDFDEVDVDPPGGAMEQPWIASVDVDGDGQPDVLLPQKNFVRAVILEQQAKSDTTTNQPGWEFRVKDQINGAARDSRITGATTLANGTNAIPSLMLLDAEHKQLTLCERDGAGVWQVVRNVALPVADFGRISTVTLGGGGTNAQSVAFLGQNAAAWLPLAGERWQLQELDGYDTPIKNGFLNDVVAGDVNSDGRKELIFMETARNYLDVVRFDARHHLVPGDRWPVFEQRSFHNRENGLPEPREVLVLDVTGDHKNDLIVLVHDRILVYPQE